MVKDWKGGKEVRLFPSPRVEVRVLVSEEMVKDYRECLGMAETLGGEGKDCGSCSWWGADIGNTCMCELMEMEGLLGREGHE